jgi:hypothetical protein
MSLRRLRVLVQNLPPGHDWSTDQLLLADLVDVARFHRAEWLMSKDAHPDRPEPIPRPGVESTEDRRAAQRAVHDHLMSQLQRGGNGNEQGGRPCR